MQGKVTVLVLIHNLGDRLPRCLESVTWADDLFLVVDPRTTDGSAEVARRYSSHVVEHPYGNKADQCNWAIPQIETEWALVLDGDEWVSPELAARIQAIIKNPTSCDGYRVKRLSYFFGKLIRHCGWDRDYNVRLFRASKGRYRQQRVHSTIEVDGVMDSIDEVMYHDDKRNFEEYFSTFQRFTTWSAQDLYDQGKRPSLFDLMIRPVSRFIKMFILRRGFLDGYHGVVLCGLASFSVFTKYAKVWNIDRLANGGAEGVPPEA